MGIHYLFTTHGKVNKHECEAIGRQKPTKSQERANWLGIFQKAPVNYKRAFNEKGS